MVSLSNHSGETASFHAQKREDLHWHCMGHVPKPAQSPVLWWTQCLAGEESGWSRCCQYSIIIPYPFLFSWSPATHSSVGPCVSLPNGSAVWPVCKIDQKCLGSALHQGVGVQRPQLSWPSFGPVTASCFTHCCSPGFPSRFDLLAPSGNQLQDTAFTGFLSSPGQVSTLFPVSACTQILVSGFASGKSQTRRERNQVRPLQGHIGVVWGTSLEERRHWTE